MIKQFLIPGLFLLVLSCKSPENTTKEISLNNKKVDKVNVFLGTSGDHGQMSPAAASPFSMLSIGPQTSPHIHAGYEHLAKEFKGFTHTRIEGVGCKGSGGNILICPFLKWKNGISPKKKQEKAFPGYYNILLDNGINAQACVKNNFGIEQFDFPSDNGGVYIDLSFAFCDRFVHEEHVLYDKSISGWIDTKTTCGNGVYRIYYYILFSNVKTFEKVDVHKYLAYLDNSKDKIEIRIGLSSVDTTYAKNKIEAVSMHDLIAGTVASWEKMLNSIEVNGEKDRKDLFYSLLYRTMQAPFLISEKDNKYRAIDGSEQTSRFNVYNGWAIWDNYREQMPLLSIMFPDRYADIANSIANMYTYGKQDWATMHEPSPTVRTEHALVVLLDAFNKGIPIDFKSIKDSLISEAERLNYDAPDKALESSYDCWALSKILKSIGESTLSEKYRNKSMDYKTYWLKDFGDLSREDVDQMQARGLYQGTIWQYRWFVPFDVVGLKHLAGGEEDFTSQLDTFFDGNYYNHANQPDLQVPGLYNATNQPWKSQKLFRNIMLDTVIQFYFNNNSKGVDPFIGRIYKNQPQAYLRTMDEDAGTMSSWFVLRSMGLSAANVGDSVFYITAPIFRDVKLKWENGNSFEIRVSNYNKDHFYIKSAILNGRPIERNWLSYKEIMKGGELVLETSDVPSESWGIKDQWITKME